MNIPLVGKCNYFNGKQLRVLLEEYTVRTCAWNPVLHRVLVAPIDKESFGDKSIPGAFTHFGLSDKAFDGVAGKPVAFISLKEEDVKSSDFMPLYKGVEISLADR